MATGFLRSAARGNGAQFVFSWTYCFSEVFPVVIRAYGYTSIDFAVLDLIHLGMSVLCGTLF